MTKQNTQDPSRQLYQNKKSAVFGRIGAYLGEMYASKQTYQPIDMGVNFDKNFISKQTTQLTKEIFGSRLYNIYTFAQKAMPAQTLSDWSDEAYNKVAMWTHGWALSRLQKDDRFGRLTHLTCEQIDDFAQDIINQNRTQLSLGGAFGVFGLKGVVLESVWFLVVSLRTVYELALIYNVDLSKKENVYTAYAIMASVDEALVSQKQILLTALAMGQMVLKNAQSTGLADELLTLSTNPLTKQYTRHLDEILEWFDMDRSDLDKFNFTWLRHLGLMACVGVSVHYNNQLFENVVGVAKATFGRADDIKLLEKSDS